MDIVVNFNNSNNDYDAYRLKLISYNIIEYICQQQNITVDNIICKDEFEAIYECDRGDNDSAIVLYTMIIDLSNNPMYTSDDEMEFLQSLNIDTYVGRHIYNILHELGTYKSLFKT